MFLWGLEQALAYKTDHDFLFKGLRSGLLKGQPSAATILLTCLLVLGLCGVVFVWGRERRLKLFRERVECSKMFTILSIIIS